MGSRWGRGCGGPSSQSDWNPAAGPTRPPCSLLPPEAAKECPAAPGIPATALAALSTPLAASLPAPGARAQIVENTCCPGHRSQVYAIDLPRMPGTAGSSERACRERRSPGGGTVLSRGGTEFGTAAGQWTSPTARAPGPLEVLLARSPDRPRPHRSGTGREPWGVCPSQHRGVWADLDTQSPVGMIRSRSVQNHLLLDTVSDPTFGPLLRPPSDTPLLDPLGPRPVGRWRFVGSLPELPGSAHQPAGLTG